MKAQQVTSVLQVKVVDASGIPVSGATITIENGKPFTTDRSGRYKLFLDKTPTLPIKAKAIKEGFRLAQLNFLEEENSVEIVMEPIVKEKKSIFGFIKVTKYPGVPVPGVTVYYNGKKYISDAQGVIKIADKVDSKKIQVEGKAVESITDDANMNIVSVSVTDKLVPENDMEKFIAYKNSIENITSEIEEDGKQLVKDLVDVQNEIASITEKLKGDQNLTPERKKELKAYVDTLEQTLARRRTEFEEAAVKTSSLIGILKKEIFSKDSLYNVAKQQLASIEEERKKVDEEYSRKVLIYSLGLLFLFIFVEGI
ncbi:MAG: carboxypeptidase-like regulatory domain-containing protein [Cytophagales bacterium]|nr:carboxypeptidase-like regulatory domain-containing protein [Cytophagales bacterium]